MQKPTADILSLLVVLIASSCATDYEEQFDEPLADPATLDDQAEQLCEPASHEVCAVGLGTSAAGVGSQECNEDGTAFGECLATACETAGYEPVDGICVDTRACLPGTTQDCFVAEGTAAFGMGTETCDGSGVGFTACSITSCGSPTYIPDGNRCISNEQCQPGSTETCFVDSALESAGTGTKTCRLDGSGFAECAIYSCNTQGYVPAGNQCVDTRACDPGAVYDVCTVAAGTDAEGRGFEYCNTVGSGPSGVCEIETCITNGFINLGSFCQDDRTCTPSTTQSCTVNDGQESQGSGLKTCNSTGSGFGSCNVSSCATFGFVSNGLTCIDQRDCNPSGGPTTQGCPNGYDKECLSNGLWGTCQLINDCSPGATQSCSGGTETCNQSGYWGSCVLTQVCSPNDWEYDGVCGYGNKRQCNSSGTDYYSCVPSCSSGQSWNGSTKTCVTDQICEPGDWEYDGPTCGYGNKRQCNSGGTDYYSCVPSCSSGQSWNSSTKTCVTDQICEPGDWEYDGPTCGYGNKRQCNSGGTDYYSCVPSCSSGQSWNGSTCVTDQICEPYDWEYDGPTCGYGNKRQCNSTGAGYGNCQDSCPNSGEAWNGDYCEERECPTPGWDWNCPSDQYVCNSSYECELRCPDSNEHWSGSQCISAETDEERYIKYVYQAIFAQQDPAGVDYWAGRLTASYCRGGFALDFMWGALEDEGDLMTRFPGNSNYVSALFSTFLKDYSPPTGAGTRYTTAISNLNDNTWTRWQATDHVLRNHPDLGARCADYGIN